MSFTFKWPRFSDDFHRDARDLLETALNKGNKPPIIADRIEVIELEMGTQPPDLEIRDIGDLTLDQFRGIFRLSYSGDAHIVLRTKVQANPLNHRKSDIHILGGSLGMVAAHQPLVVPMLLRLSHFVLNAYVVLVVSRQKGITLVFKTDPLQNVNVNSTFDSIAVIQKYIQREIEGQLREMFREDLPGIVHRLSQRWVSGKAKVETPYLFNRPPRLHTTSEQHETMSAPDVTLGTDYHLALTPDPQAVRRPQSLSGVPSFHRTYFTLSPHTPPSIVSSPTPYSFPTKRAMDDAQTTFPGIENFDPTYGFRQDNPSVRSGYKGFGRLFEVSKGLGELAEEPSEDNEADSFHMVDWEEAASFTSPPSAASEELSHHDPLHGAQSGSPPNFRSVMDADGSIVLRPGLNNSISHLSTLSHSNHTLSPYTRSLEHFTVRSVPHRGSGTPALDRQPMKAKRKRTYRLGVKKPPDPDHQEDMNQQRAGSFSPPPPSEFEASDVEHYFRVPNTSSLRRRASYQSL